MRSNCARTKSPRSKTSVRRRTSLTPSISLTMKSASLKCVPAPLTCHTQPYPACRALCCLQNPSSSTNHLGVFLPFFRHSVCRFQVHENCQLVRALTATKIREQKHSFFTPKLLFNLPCLGNPKPLLRVALDTIHMQTSSERAEVEMRLD